MTKNLLEGVGNFVAGGVAIADLMPFADLSKLSVTSDRYISMNLEEREALLAEATNELESLVEAIFAETELDWLVIAAGENPYLYKYGLRDDLPTDDELWCLVTESNIVPIPFFREETLDFS